MKRLVAAAVAALALTVAAAPHASATTGGHVCNMASSDHNLYVTAYRPARNWVIVPIGRCSSQVGVANVQAFMSGWRLQSVWVNSNGTVSRGYVYPAATTIYMSKDGVRISLDVLP